MPFLILFCFILRGFLFPYHEERSGTDHNDRGRSHRQQKRCSALRRKQHDRAAVFEREHNAAAVAGIAQLVERAVARSGLRQYAISPGISKNTMIRLHTMLFDSTRPRS